MLASPRLTSGLLLLVLSCTGGGDGTTDDSTTTTTSTTSTTGTSTTGTLTTDTPTTDTPTTAATSTSGSTSGSSGPPPNACEGDAPRVRLSTTMGDLVVQLDAVNAPITVANFISYVESGFYEGTIFHRVIDSFVAQGGGFTADLQLKPTDPPIPLEVSPALTHVDGAIAMARTMVLDSATSQFYLCDGPQHGLDGQYAVFGALVEGQDVLAAISAVATQSEGGYDNVPVTDILVTAATCE